MPALKALKSFSYNKVKLQAGDLFKCKDKHVPILVHSHLATRPEVEIEIEAVKPDVVGPPRDAKGDRILTYQTRRMEADDNRILDRSEASDFYKKPRTVAELRAEAEAKGIHLPSGYITKSELADILSKA